jgi:hypothetical protein
MTDQTTAAPRTTASLLRRILVGVIIVSFGLAAVLGIIVLLGVELGEAAGKVLATTAIVGAFSVAVLCCASLLGRRPHMIGVIGVIVSIVTAVLVIWIVWDGELASRWDSLFRVLWTGVAATASLALASLLLLLVDRRRSAVRIGLFVTLGLIALLFVLTAYMAWARDIEWEIFSRVYGIVAILTALGAVVVPVLSLLLPDARARAAVDHALLDRLAAEARRRGITVEELVAPVLAPESADPAPAGPQA